MQTSVATERASVQADPRWHLRAIGLDDDNDDAAPAGEPNGDDVSPTVAVGIVDTGCQADHPDIRGAVVDEIDFCPFDRGAVYDGGHSLGNLAEGQVRDGLARLGLDGKRWPGEHGDLLDELVTAFGDGTGVHRFPLPDPARRHGSHGTACAGLVAAAPSGREDGEGAGGRGVLPGCHIVSVAAPFGFEVRPVLNALLHCIGRGVDVLLLPRGVDGSLPRGFETPEAALAAATHDLDHDHDDAPDTRHYGEDRDARATRVLGDEDRLRDLALLGELLHALSSRLPVVVAAGNGGRDRPEYPARLHGAPDDGRGNDLIVVGAHARDGHRAGYSSGREGTVTLFAPSDDVEVYDAERCARYSTEAFERLAGGPPVPGTRRECSPWAIATLDTTHRGAYQWFGGTSAASAIVAGAVASLQQRYAALSGSSRRLSGRAMARLLAESARETEAGLRGLDLGAATKRLLRSHAELETTD